MEFDTKSKSAARVIRQKPLRQLQMNWLAMASCFQKPFQAWGGHLHQQLGNAGFKPVPKGGRKTSVASRA